MRRNVKNEKVLRAITLGLAAMMAVMSTPMTVLADGENGESTSGSEETSTTTPNQGQQEQAAPTVDSASGDAVAAAALAENYTGSLSDKGTENPKTIGESVSEALGVIASGEAAVSAGNDLYDKAETIGTYVDELSKQGTAGKPEDYSAQITDAESTEKKQEKAFGVTLDEDGNVTDRTELDSKVDNANGAIASAKTAKSEAYNALTVEKSAIDTANGLIKDANTAKGTADADTTAANNAAAEVGKLDSDTKAKLDAIENTLRSVKNEKDPEKAVGIAKGASDAAVQVVTKSLTDVQTELQSASNAANDAERNSDGYDYQEMANLANRAQIAANNAKAAADLADKAVETLEEKEQAAKTALDDTEKALKKAQGDAVDVLNAYKKSLDEINAKITTANGSRSNTQDAMTKANTAIDTAIKLMSDTSDTSGTTVEKKVAAMNEAISLAKTAINGVTGLMYDENDKAKYDSEDTSKAERERLKEILKQNDFYKAERKRIDTQTKLTNKANELAKAKETYDGVITAKGQAAVNKATADQAVQDIDGLINGINNLYDQYLAAVDADINDLKALLSGNTVGYEKLKETAQGCTTDFGKKESALIEANKAMGGSEEDQNLTAEQIVAKYDKAASDNQALDGTISSLSTTIGEKEATIADYNSRIATVLGEAQSAQGDLSSDLGALDKKYVYSYNEVTKEYEFATDEEGKPVYTDDYKKLVGRSQATKSEYKCGDEVLAKADADYVDESGNAIYKKTSYYAGRLAEPDTKPPRLTYNEITNSNVTYVKKGDRLEETAECEYERNLPASAYKEVAEGERYILGKNNKVDENTIKGYVAYMIADDLGISVSKIDLNNIVLGTDQSGNNTITYTRPGEYPKNSLETRTYSYNWSSSTVQERKNAKGELLYYYIDIDFSISRTKAILTGSYTEITEYNCEKFDLYVTPTPDALKAQSDLQKIDSAADTAKGQVNDHLRAKEEKAKTYSDLTNAYGSANYALYGEGGSADNPAAGSLLDQKRKAEATRSANQTILDTLGTIVSEYKTVKGYKQVADANLKKADEFDIDTATGISEEDKTKYKNALGARQRIVDAKDDANGYLGTAKTNLQTLATDITNAKDGVTKYGETKTKIDNAQSRLDAVDKKLKTLKTLQKEAEGKLTAKFVDENITLDDGTTVNILALNTALTGELAGLTKFTPEEISNYNELNYVHAEYMGLDEISLAAVSESLAARINSLPEMISEQRGKLTELAKEKADLVAKAQTIRGYANKAQDEANRAATALRNWRAPEEGGEEGGDDETTGAYITSGLGLDIDLLTGGNLVAGTGLGINGGVTGGRAGAVANNVADIQGNRVPLAGSVSSNGNDNTNDNKKVVKQNFSNIGDNLVPLDGGPKDVDSAPKGLLALYAIFGAAAIGFGGYEYSRKKNEIDIMPEKDTK